MHAPLASFGPSLRPSALVRSKASAVASASVLGPAGLLRKAFHAVIPSALALLVIATGSNARADDSIKADTTLKSNNSVVTRSKAADGKTTYTITGGASQNSGRYLFHSFAAFNLLLNEVGHFDNLTTVNTIFSRVTGLNQSSINGLIKANGAANLYLINPKGIVFGPNARIDVGGAFKASTAEALLFNGQEFSAIKADVEPVLTSDIVPGLQFGASPATLSNAGVLVVKDGQEILLAGGPGDTLISSGTITANGGAIKLEGGNITVSGGGIQANNGGSINLSADKSISVSGPVVISAENKGSGKGGDINLTGPSITLEKGARINTQTTITNEDIFSKDNSGNILKDNSGNPIIIIAANKGVTGDVGNINLSANNVSLKDNSLITTETQTTGKGGLISVDSNNLNLVDGSQLVATTTGAGNGGSINLSTKSLQLGDNSKISSSASGSGKGGAITVAPAATAPLEIKGPGLIETKSTGSGTAGVIRIGSTSADQGSTTASDLSLSDGVQLQTSRASVDLAATGNTSFQGGSIEATGGSIKLDGTDTSISGGSLSANQGGSISVKGSSKTELTGGSLQADGGSITISGSNSTNLSGPSLTANSVSIGGVEKTGRIVVGGSLSGSPAAATATSKSTEIGSGTSLSAVGGGIDVLSTGSTTSSGSLDASGGAIKLAGSTTTINGGSLTANQGGTISVTGDSKALISGGNLSAPNITSRNGSISVQGGDIEVGKDSGRTILLAGNGALKKAPQAGESDETTASNLTLLDGAVSLAAGTGRLIEIYSGSASSPGQTILRAAGANSANTADATAVRVSTSGTGGNVVVGGRFSATAVPVSATTIGDGVGITAKDGSISFGTTGKISLGSGSQLQAGGYIDLRGNSTEEITTSFLDKIAGSSRWFIGQAVDINSTNYTPTSDRSLTINAPAITVKSFSLTPSASSWQMASGVALDLQATGSGGLSFENLDLSFTRTGSGAHSTSADLFRATSEAGGTSISQGSKISKISASGGGIRLSGSTRVAIADAELKANQGGLISVTGGDLEVGKASGRTILLAGSGALKAGEFAAEAPNLTLLDGGDGSAAAISLTGGANKTIQIFSGAAAPATPQGITNVRGATTVTATAPAASTATPAHRIVVGGVLAGPSATATATSSATSVGSGSSITANGGGLIDVLSTGATSSSGAISASQGTLNLKGSELSISGGSLQADGGSITISGNNNIKLGRTSLTSKNGSISVQGGDIEVGQATGRTILLAGGGALQAGESALEAPNLTLLDGGSDTTTGISLKAGDGKSIKVMSSILNGTTTLRGATEATTSGGSIKFIGKTVTNNILLDPESKIEYKDVDNLKFDSKTFSDYKFSDDTSTWFTAKAATSVTFDSVRLNAGTQGRGIINVEAPIINLNNSTFIADGPGGLIEFESPSHMMTSININNSIITTKCGPQSCKAMNKAGSIYLKAESIIALNNSTLTAETLSPGQGGNIEIKGASIKLDSSTLTVQTSGTGEGGYISLESFDSINLSNGAKINAQATITTEDIFSKDSFGNILKDSSGSPIIEIAANKGITGDAGNINLSANAISLVGKSIIAAKTQTSGEGGLISINSGKINLFGGSQLTTEATNTSTSKAGDISLNNDSKSSRDLTIFFSGKDPEGNYSKINAQTASIGIGNLGKGGDMKIGTSNQKLTIHGDTSDQISTTRITAQTNGVGNGGSISLFGSDINIINKAKVSAKTTNAGIGGTVNVDAAALSLAGGSQLTTEATNTSTSRAGDIYLNNDVNSPRSLSILFSGDGSVINAQTASNALEDQGRGGSINIGSANQSLSIGGNADNQISTTRITAQTNGAGAGGSISLFGSDITISNHSKITAETIATGNGGAINVDTSSLALFDGSQLSTAAFSTGDAGSVLLNANTPRDLAISFSGNSFINAATELTAPGGGQGGTIKLGTSAKTLSISGQGSITAETKGSGKGGAVELKGSSISLDNGAIASAQTSGSGRSGTISVEANTITLDNSAKLSTRSSSGSDVSPQPTGPAGSINIIAAGPNSLHLRNGSQISSDTSSTIAWANDNDLANIIINTPHLTLEGASSISASTSAAAKAGAINLISTFTELGAGSSIATASTGSGAGGNININGTRLLLNGASQFKADGGNFGQAGSINISLRDRLQLDNQSSINASTARSASKQGGANISITLGGGLVLNNGSSITATASGKANGGNIKLLLPNGFLLSSFPAAFAGNDILASADAGDGGRIELRALGIFGMNINTFFTPISEASAKSRSGRDGVLALYIPFLTPDRGVVPIEQPLDPDNDLVRACSPRGDGRRAEFTQTGRGGQPSLPGDRPTAAPLLDDLGRPAPRRGLQTSASLSSTSQPAPAAAIPVASAIQLQGYAPRLALPLPPCPEPR